MNLASRIAGSLGVVVRGEGGGMPRALSGHLGDRAPRDTGTSDLMLTYQYHSWVYSAIKAIARSCSSVPFIVVRRKSSDRNRSRPIRDFAMKYRTRMGWNEILSWKEVMDAYIKEENVEVCDDHEVLRVLEHPMPDADKSRTELIQAIVTNLELDGNAYVEKIWSDGDRDKIPDKLWAEIDPRKIYVIPGKGVVYGGFMYVGSEVKYFLPDDMLAFRYYNPLNPYYGQSPTRVLRSAIIGDIRAVDWNRMFFENDATPGGLLSSKERLTPSDIRLMEDSWNGRHRGSGREHGIGVIGQGTTFQALSPGHKDMGFKDLRELTQQEVQATYGVPSVVLGNYKDANRASAMTQARLFTTNTVLPRLAKMEGVFDRHFFGIDGEYKLMFDLSTIEALQEDILVRARAGHYLKDQRWTVNEIRKFNKLPPIVGELANAVLVPSNMIVAGVIEGTTMPVVPDAPEVEDE